MKNFIDLNRYHIPDLIKLYNYKNYTEIGIAKGDFILNVLARTKINIAYGVDPFLPLTSNQCGWNGTNICIDQEIQNQNKSNCLKKLEHHKNRFKFYNLSSVDYGKSLQDNTLDIVFIDGDHSEEGVTNDLEIYYKKIRKGGLLVGHDYGGDFGNCEKVVNVKPAVDKFCRNNNIDYSITSPNFNYKSEGVQSFFIFKN